MIDTLLSRVLPRSLASALERQSDSGEILRGGALVFLIQVVGVGVMYTCQVLLAQWAGASEFGLYAYAWTWVTIFAVLTPLGLNESVLRFVPAHTAKGEWPLVRGFLRVSPVVVLAGSAVAGLAGVLAVPILSDILGDGYREPILLALACTPFFALITLYQGSGRALGSVVVAFAPKAIGVPLIVGVAAGAVVLAGGDLDAEVIMVISLAACAALALVQGLALRRRYPAEARAVAPEMDIRGWLRVSVPMLMAAGAQLVLNYANLILIGFFLPPEDVGVFHAAARTAVLVAGVLMAINALAAPKIASLHAQGRLDELQRIVSQVIHVIFWPSLGAAVVFVVFGEEILSIFGARFGAGHAALAVLAIGQLVNAGAGPVGYLLTMTGHQDTVALVFWVGAAVNIALNLVLIPLFGILGAAIATAATMIYWNLWLIVLVRKRLDIRSYIFAAPRAGGRPPPPA